MRKIITIVFLFAFPFLITGQDHVAIKLRCPAFITKIREPILVVNGLLWEYAALDSIDPLVINQHLPYMKIKTAARRLLTWKEKCSVAARLW